MGLGIVSGASRAGIVLALLATGAAGCGGDSAGAGPGSPVEQEAQLRVVTPTSGQILTSLEVAVEGSATEGIAEVLVNGRAVPVEGGAFATTIQQAEGLRTIKVEAAGVETIEIDIAVDVNLPELDITAPERGLFVEGAQGDQLVVKGSAFDSGAGIDRVEIGGFPVALGAEGAFEASVPLNVGANILEIVAFDKAGRSTSALRGAIYGDFVPWGEPMGDAVTGRLTPETLDVAEQALQAQLQAGFIDNLLAGVLPTGEDEDFRVERFEYGEVTVDLTLHEGYIGIVAAINGLSIDVTFEKELSIADVDISGGLDIDPARITTELVITLDGAGLPVFEQRNTVVSLENFNLRGEGLLDVVFTIMEQFAREKAEEALVDLVEDFVVPQLFDPSLLNLDFNLLSQRLILNILLESIAVTPQGIDVVGNVDMPLGPALGIPDSPGVLTTPGRPPQGSPRRMVRLAMAEDFFNKLLFTAWRAGGLRINVNELVGEGGELPIELDVGALALLVGDDLKAHASADTPVDIELVPLLPPVASVEPGSFPLKVQVPDLIIDLYLAPEGGPRVKWAAVSVSLALDVTARVVDGELDLEFEVEAWADLIEEPLFELDDERVESMVVGLFEALPRIFGPRGLDGIIDLSTISLLGVRIGAGEVKASGTSSNFLSAEVDLVVPEIEAP